MARGQLGRTQEFLKQIVYGGNDGIVTTFAIVAGFAGARAEGAAGIGVVAVLVFGLANLFADAVSMGLGEFLSARTQRNLYRGQHAGILRQIARDPSTTRDELARLLHARGLRPVDAESSAALIALQPDLMAEMIMRYGAGLSDPEQDNPALNGLVTFVSFVVFGVVPLVPYFMPPTTQDTLLLSTLATLISLCALGLLRWNATGEGLVRSVGETVLVGSICALVAFAVGMLVGG